MPRTPRVKWKVIKSISDLLEEMNQLSPKQAKIVTEGRGGSCCNTVFHIYPSKEIK